MGFISFSDWLLARESSAFTRLRRDAALGLKPPIPSASVNSRSTASPFENEKLADKPKDKKKSKKKKEMIEAKNNAIDSFLNAVGALRAELEKLKSDDSNKESDKPLDKVDKDSKVPNKEKDDKKDTPKDPKVDPKVDPKAKPKVDPKKIVDPKKVNPKLEKVKKPEFKQKASKKPVKKEKEIDEEV